jgi:phosphoenolpyruvate carboxykinase (ATP)
MIAPTRGTNGYARGRLGTEYVFACDGVELAQWDPKGFYSDEQVEAYVADLVDGRRKFTEEIAGQGLRKEIRELAHKELDDTEGKRAKKVEEWAPPAEPEERAAAEDRDPRSRFISPWEPRRPSASYFPLPAGKSRR